MSAFDEKQTGATPIEIVDYLGDILVIDLSLVGFDFLECLAHYVAIDFSVPIDQSMPPCVGAPR